MTTEWQDDPNKTPRTPVQAGRFYPGEDGLLSRSIDKMLAEVKAEAGQVPRAIIVPHAGYQFSGPAAAHAYKIFQQPESASIKRVILLATSHYTYVRGVVLGEHPYQTPLGAYPVDTQAIEMLKKLDFPHVKNKIAVTREHSDEVQIPFLQKVLPQAQLVPIIVGDLDEPGLESTAKALSTIVDEHTVFVTSSDFTHYGVNFDYTPQFDNDTRTGIYGLDQGAIDCIARRSSAKFTDYIEQTGATICGANPIRLLLKIFEVNHWPGRVRVLTYYTSGDLTGDWEHSVSYAAIALGTLEEAFLIMDQKFLNAAEEQTLLKLARFVLENFITRGVADFSESKLSDFQLTEGLRQKLGVFVTLKEYGDLRGCIGNIVGIRPLYQGVVENAQNAAAHDPRFDPVTPEELDRIEIEISVMSPLEPVKSLDEILVGRDGLVLKKGFHSGVFLPQVPVEWNWDKTTYLEQLGLKAGLARDAYKDPQTELLRFSAQVFGETE
jgi:AmmeMemoRadiSam system protein B/AmmeMemoRadiSam system protein A